MEPLDWKRVKEIFLAAVELPPQERTAFIATQCGADSELCAQVERLLVQHQTPTVLGPTDAGAHSNTILAALDRIGSYRILNVLGEGGMGIVYLAHQDRPARTVALKMIRPGLATPAMLRRFEHESQVLARLQHPSIAQVYEAGAVDAGRGPQPYFVMEFVEGSPLLERVRAAGLSLRDRLLLFQQICEAIHHAHVKGVIHRDLKPANILVDGSGRPRILDFGIARVVDAELPLTLCTEQGQLVGTLPYMSPEQAAGEPDDVDVRSDIYTLGVVLYELLAESPPWEPGRRSIADALRAICEQDPPPLSAHDRTLRGELENIVSKAMAKDRGCRYQSAAEFSADIERYLRQEPVLAQPPSRIYHLRKFVARNRKVTAFAAAALALITASSILSTTLYLRTRAAEERAEHHLRRVRAEAAKSEQIAVFSRGIFAGIEPEFAADLDKTLLRRILDTAAERLDEELEDHLDVEAAMRDTVGSAYLAIGEYQPALHHLTKALELYIEFAGEDDPRTIRAVHMLGRGHLLVGSYAECEPLLLEALERRRRVLGPNHVETAETTSCLGILYERTSRFEAAELLHLEALETFRTLDESDIRVAYVMNDLGTLYNMLGRFAEAEAFLIQAIAAAEDSVGSDMPFTLRVLNNLALAWTQLGRHEEALGALTRVLETFERINGPDHPDVLLAAGNLAHLLTEMGKHERALPLAQRAVDGRLRLHGWENQNALIAVNNLARLYGAMERYEEARELNEQVLAIRRRLLGDDHFDTLGSMNNLAGSYRGLERHEEAEALFAEALARGRVLLPPEHWAIANFLIGQGRALAALGRFDEALPVLLEANEILQAALSVDHPRVQGARKALAALYRDWDRPDDAAAWEAGSDDPAPDPPTGQPR
jgi:eukaryotic-like serine/threonine-protein kinase